jgi:putative membrane protein
MNNGNWVKQKAEFVIKVLVTSTYSLFNIVVSLTSTFNFLSSNKQPIMIANIFIGLIAFIHLYILWMEMFAWTTVGKKTFKSLPEYLFEPTKVLAANQGLYNGFLSAGLIWSLFIADAQWHKNVALFFLICVLVAGIYGALTASKKIFFVQALPALIAIALLLFA